MEIPAASDLRRHDAFEAFYGLTRENRVLDDARGVHNATQGGHVLRNGLDDAFDVIRSGYISLQDMYGGPQIAQLVEHGVWSCLGPSPTHQHEGASSSARKICACDSRHADPLPLTQVEGSH